MDSSDTQPTAIARDQSKPLAGIGRLERLPKWLNLVPMVSQWLWLSLRYRSVTLPSCANPAITAGGMVGEGKLEYLYIMGRYALAATATTTSVRAAGFDSVDQAEAAMQRCGLAYPIVAKPDLGWCGFGVRRVDNRRERITDLEGFPRGERVVIQRYIAGRGEAGLFYLRRPEDARGRLIGLLPRHYPRVIGDGVHTVAELIAADPRARRLGGDGASEAGCDLTTVPAPGEEVRIATVGSTRVGGLYENASASITPAMTDAIDSIALDKKDFHVGRFDVKFESLGGAAGGARLRDHRSQRRGLRSRACVGPVVEPAASLSHRLRQAAPVVLTRRCHASPRAPTRRSPGVGAALPEAAGAPQEVSAVELSGLHPPRYASRTRGLPSSAAAESASTMLPVSIT